MYRIRLTTGEEAVYRSLEELRKGISSGVVGPDAEVFHKAGRRWLPIQTHPDYRLAISGQRPAIEPPGESQQAPVEQEVFLPQSGVPPTDFSTDPVPAQPELLAPAPGDDLAPLPPPAYHSAPRTKRLRLVLSVALGVAVIGAKVVISHLRPSAPSAGILLTQSAGMPPAPMGLSATPSLPADSAPVDTAGPASVPPPVDSQAPLLAARSDSFQLVYPAPSAPLALGPEPGADSALPRESRLVTRLKGSRSRMPSYFEAYADARAELDEGLSYIHFRRVFAPSRFASPESLRAARRMVAAAGNIMRVYRGAEVMLEQTYRPDDADSKGSLREPFETSQAARELVANIDSLFGVLLAQQGQVRIQPDGVRFQSPRAARTYAELRGEILRSLTAWRDSAEASRRVTVPRLVRGIGTTPPPPLH